MYGRAMTWILIGVAAAVAALALAHRLLALWGGAAGRPIVAGLVYAAAVVLAAQVVDAAIDIDTINQGLQGFGHGFEAKATAQAVANHLGDVAWQTGLLVAAAAIVSVLQRPAGARPGE